jgi:glycosyltransferase involved in cell wall biosynthesis
MIKTQFFFRKPVTGYHSIEVLFSAIIRNMPGDISPEYNIMPCPSKGFILRLINILIAPFFQKDVNHITGDIHYISYLLRKRKTILTIHDLEIVERSSFFIRKFFLLFWFYIPYFRVRYITVISEFTKNELIKFSGLRGNKIKVIYDCIPGEIPWSPQPFNADCPVILHIGTKPNKNLERLIKAIKGISCKLVIIGKLEPKQINLLKDSLIKYENYVNLSYNQVIEQFKYADMLSFISTYEGFGLPILEAQSIGRPVITGNISSMPEVAGNGALFADPYNIASIRKGILNLINNETLREDLIQKGQNNILRFQPKNIAEQYAELYRSIAGKKSAARSKTEDRGQRAENREQRTKNREQRKEKREKGTEGRR